MKVKDAIAAADAVKPNAFSEETKFQWLRRLEGRLQAEVFLMAPAQIRELDLQYPADMDRELLVDPPYDDLYPVSYTHLQRRGHSAGDADVCAGREAASGGGAGCP